MPELPDVEVFKTYLNACALHQRIGDVEVVEPKVLLETSPAQLKRHLKNNALTNTDRHGKHLFVHTDGSRVLRLHFGMTGFLKYFKDTRDRPAHTRMQISFTNGYHCAYSCRRLLGEVALEKDIADFTAQNNLGPDALDISYEAFRDAVCSSKKAIKSLLMDQAKIAGLGNIYADEILFQAALHPKYAAKKINESQIENLYRTMKHVLRYAIDKKADPQQFGSSYLLPQRHGGGTCPRCGTGLSQIKVTGRTSYTCPECQPLN